MLLYIMILEEQRKGGSDGNEIIQWIWGTLH